jgi:hypothetical protein
MPAEKKHARKKGGRAPAHYTTYKNDKRREKNKTKHIAKSNGVATARNYASKFGLLTWAERSGVLSARGKSKTRKAAWPAK